MRRFILVGCVAILAAGVALKDAPPPTARQDHDAAVEVKLREMLEDLEKDEVFVQKANFTEVKDIWDTMLRLVGQFSEPTFPFHSPLPAKKAFAMAICESFAQEFQNGLIANSNPDKPGVDCNKFMEYAVEVVNQQEVFIAWTNEESEAAKYMKKRLLAGYLAKIAILCMQDASNELWNEVVLAGNDLKGLQNFTMLIFSRSNYYRQIALPMVQGLQVCSEMAQPEIAQERLNRILAIIAPWGPSYMDISNLLADAAYHHYHFLKKHYKHSGWESETINRLMKLNKDLEEENKLLDEFIRRNAQTLITMANGGDDKAKFTADYALKVVHTMAKDFMTHIMKTTHATVQLIESISIEEMRRLAEIETMANQSVASQLLSQMPLERMGLKHVSRKDIEVAVRLPQQNTSIAGDVTVALHALLAKQRVQEEHPRIGAKIDNAVDDVSRKAVETGKVTPQQAAAIVNQAGILRTAYFDSITAVKAIHFDTIDATDQVVRKLKKCIAPYMD